MIKRNHLILLLGFIAGVTYNLTAQFQDTTDYQLAMQLLHERGEVDIGIQVRSKQQVHQLTKMMSVDYVRNTYVRANANLKEFRDFLTLKIPYQVILPDKPPSLEDIRSKGTLADWTKYPTYEEYDSIMRKFAGDYPEICLLDTIGESVNGRYLLAVKISDSVEINEPEPRVFYSSTMHGDETTGYILMLRLIDHLLTNYDTDSLVTRLINETEIWINPLANPDGTYASGNHTVFGSIRRNANGVDLNRNFPDPEDGAHPDGNEYQPETIAMMEFMQKFPPVMSANFHGGAEVLNYPWDTWYKRHPDNDWFKFICHEYADTAQAYSSNYLTGFDDGITNGYDWYSISGGRQDYVTYFLRGREVTIELDNTKTTPEAELENHWQYNYRSLLNFINQTLYGITGEVTDSVTGEPLKARIEIRDHDADSSHTWSDSLSGYFRRLIHEGFYNLRISSPGYIDKYIDSVKVENRTTNKLDIVLVPAGSQSANLDLRDKLNVQIFPNPFVDRFSIHVELAGPDPFETEVYNVLGSLISRCQPEKISGSEATFNIDLSDQPDGIYFIRVLCDGKLMTKKIVKQK